MEARLVSQASFIMKFSLATSEFKVDAVKEFCKT